MFEKELDIKISVLVEGGVKLMVINEIFLKKLKNEVHFKKKL